jgi:hypothetical protein
MNAFAKLFYSNAYYWNENNRLTYLRGFSGVITSPIIEWYRDLFSKLDSESRQKCIVTLKSEGLKSDIYYPVMMTTSVTLLAVAITLISIFLESKHSMLLGLTSYVLLAMLAILRGILVDSRRRAHLSVMLSVLEEQMNSKSAPEDR